MQRAAAIPYYTSGATTGLALGYLYAWLQVVQLIPGLRWVADIIRSILPKAHTAQQYCNKHYDSTSSSCPASAAAAAPAPPLKAASAAADKPHQPLDANESMPDVELSSGSFAVMHAGALGSALYEMERPTNTADTSSSSNLLPPTPHPSFQTASNPAAAALRGISALDNTTAAADETADTATSPAAAAGGDGASIDQMQQMLSLLRDRLTSFPLDYVSPTTTATALSRYSNLPPAGNSEYGGDEPSPYIDLAVGPAEPVEGDLDFTVTNSTGSNLLPPETPAAAEDLQGGSGSSSTTVLPTPGDTVVPLLSLPAGKRAGTGATVKFAPGVTGSPIPSGVTSGVTSYPAEQQQQQQQHSSFSGIKDSSSSTVPLTDSAVQKHNRYISSSSGKATVAEMTVDNSFNSYGLGSPRSSYTVGLPAQRVVVTKLSRTGSTVSSTSSSPRRHYEQQRQQRCQGSPSAAAAAGFASPVKAASAAAAATMNARTGAGVGGVQTSPDALQPPRLPSAHAAVAVPAAAYSAATAAAEQGGGSSSSAYMPAAAGEVDKLLSTSSSGSGNGDDSRPVTDTPPSAIKTLKPAPSAHGRGPGTRTLDLQPSTPASTSGAAAGMGVTGSPRSMHSMSSIQTTDSAGTVERKKQKGLLSMLKSKATKGRQQVR